MEKKANPIGVRDRRRRLVRKRNRNGSDVVELEKKYEMEESSAWVVLEKCQNHVSGS